MSNRLKTKYFNRLTGFTDFAINLGIKISVKAKTIIFSKMLT